MRDGEDGAASGRCAAGSGTADPEGDAMIFPNGIGLAITPQDTSLMGAFQALLTGFVRARMERRACRSLLERSIVELHLDPELFDPAQIDDGGLFATDRLLFPRED